jgi:hypothetical protein
VRGRRSRRRRRLWRLPRPSWFYGYQRWLQFPPRSVRRQPHPRRHGALFRSRRRWRGWLSGDAGLVGWALRRCVWKRGPGWLWRTRWSRRLRGRWGRRHERPAGALGGQAHLRSCDGRVELPQLRGSRRRRRPSRLRGHSHPRRSGRRRPELRHRGRERRESSVHHELAATLTLVRA